ncbi:MAG: GlxA family transcriptional regulator [Pseudomonadota bacterium]
MTPSSEPTILICIVVVPNFNLAATSAFIDAFRVANYIDGKTHFRWDFVSESGGLCPASNGTGIETLSIKDISGKDPDIVLVSSSWTPEDYASRTLLNALRGWARKGATMAALDTGAFILAEAGLLDGKNTTVHYEHIDAFQELYPGIGLSENLFVFDGNRVSCCGGTASTEFGLHLLLGIHGSALANAAARYIFHPKLRHKSAQQLPEEREPLGSKVPAKVRSAIKLMEQNLEEPISIPELCAQIDISQRQLDRLFAQYLRKPPKLYYRDIRLDRARALVTQTEIPISEVAFACGFSNSVHFSRAYKTRFGVPPSKDRLEGRAPFDFRAWPMQKPMGIERRK